MQVIFYISLNYFRGLQNWPDQLNKSIKIDTQKLNALTIAWKMLLRSRKKRNRCGSVAFDCPLDDLAVRTYSYECLFSIKVLLRFCGNLWKIKEK